MLCASGAESHSITQKERCSWCRTETANGCVGAAMPIKEETHHLVCYRLRSLR